MRKKRTIPAPTSGWLEMSKEERAAWLRENGKGFLSQEEQEEELRLCHGKIESVYRAEADKAHKANDDETFWQWFSLIAVPAHFLMSLKQRNGADFIRELDFDTRKADEAYGPGWLEE